MKNSKISIPHNTFLISTSIKSFGFIISDTNIDSKLSATSFFELYKFDPDTTQRIYGSIRRESGALSATDTDGNIFLFYTSPLYANLFAFVKKLDIDADMSATIVYNGQIPDEHAVTALTQSLLPARDRQGLIVTETNALPPAFGDYLLPSEYALNKTTAHPSIADGYVFSKFGFVLFMSFLYMTASALDLNIQLTLDAKSGVISAELDTSGRDTEIIILRLDFMRRIMDTQNLNLFYKKGEALSLLFLPFYIDDGLYGVKAPINILLTREDLIKWQITDEDE